MKRIVLISLLIAATIIAILMWSNYLLNRGCNTLQSSCNTAGLRLDITIPLVMPLPVVPAVPLQERPQASTESQAAPDVIVDVPVPGGCTPEMDGKRITWLLDRAIENEKRSRRVGQVNQYLAGSPMAGLGELIVAHADRTGVNFAILPAVACAESSLGRQNCGSYNAYGMLGCNFSSWENGVERFFDNVVKNWGPVQSAHELVNPNYCEPPTVWCQNVQGQMDYISGIQP